MEQFSINNKHVPYGLLDFKHVTYISHIPKTIYRAMTAQVKDKVKEIEVLESQQERKGQQRRFHIQSLITL